MEEAEAKPSTARLAAHRAPCPKEGDGSARAYRVPMGSRSSTRRAVARAGAVDPYLPAVSAGGLDYVYQSPTRATSPAPATGPHPARVADVPGVHVPRGDARAGADRVPARARAQRRQAAAAARAGDDFGDGELVGVGEIETTGPGGDIELPLGADQDVKLVRQVVPSTKTTA